MAVTASGAAVIALGFVLGAKLMGPSPSEDPDPTGSLRVRSSALSESAPFDSSGVSHPGLPPGPNPNMGQPPSANGGVPPPPGMNPYMGQPAGSAFSPLSPPDPNGSASGLDASDATPLPFGKNLIVLKPAPTPIPYSPMIHSVSPLEAKVAPPATDDLAFAKSCLGLLAEGDLSVAAQIDWQVLRANGRDVGTAYSGLFEDSARRQFRNNFISQFWLPYKARGLAFDSFTNWSLAPGANNHLSVVTFTDSSGREDSMTVFHLGSQRLLVRVTLSQ